MVLQGEDLRQKEEQTDGQDDEEYFDSCKPGEERTKIHLCEGSRPLESRQDEKGKSWSGEKFREDGRRAVQENSEMGEEDKKVKGFSLTGDKDERSKLRRKERRTR